MLKTVPIPYVTTLEQLQSEFNDSLHAFVTFRVQKGDQIISNVSIPSCRFRQDDENFKHHGLIEARSCDCNGTICGHPTQRLYLSESQMKHYVFVEQFNLNYIFTYMID